MHDAIELNPVSEGTNVARFLANRGAIVIKETRAIGRCKGEHGDAISVETVLLNVVKGTKKETSYGIRLERTASGDFESAVFLDYDELSEFIAAIDFISKTASQLQNQKRDYTEVTYSTKDSAKVGFYHSDGGQLAFLSLSNHRGSTFLPLPRLVVLKDLIETAEGYLKSRGAGEN